MPSVHINGLETHYECRGEGDAVVLLHNGFSCGMMWDRIAPLVTVAGFQTLVYDRRGYGRSDGGPDFEHFYTSDDFRGEAVAALIALVDHLGIDRFHIVGQCEGGVVGVDAAVAHPRRVVTLAAASTLCTSAETMVAFNRRKFPAAFARLPAEIQQKYIRWHGRKRAEAFYRLCSRYGGAYGKGVFDLTAQLAAVGCPTLVMYPDRGYFFEVEQGVMMYRHLSRGELAVFPKCGHNIFEHYPERYAQQVIDFIGRNRC
jgi:pimeloyl-ACP methyl ester carboxylesterase